MKLQKTNFLPRRNAAKGVLAFACFSGALCLGNVIKETQDVLSEWIDVEKQISSDRSEWQSQKAVMRNSIEFMEGELSRLQETIETANESASAGERKRAELEAEKGKLDAVMEDMSSAIGGYEEKVLEMAETWPEAFLKQVETPLKRIPTEEQVDSAPLTMRLQNVIVILSQFDKFQSMITKDTGIQDVDGTPREVTTLYYGFAYAYFVDGSGEYAGYGYPEKDGWNWVADASLAPKVSELLSVYDRNVDASFVGLPARIVTQ